MHGTDNLSVPFHFGCLGVSACARLSGTTQGGGLRGIFIWLLAAVIRKRWRKSMFSVSPSSGQRNCPETFHRRVNNRPSQSQHALDFCHPTTSQIEDEASIEQRHLIKSGHDTGL